MTVATALWNPWGEGTVTWPFSEEVERVKLVIIAVSVLANTTNWAHETVHDTAGKGHSERFSCLLMSYDRCARVLKLDVKRIIDQFKEQKNESHIVHVVIVIFE
jgi:hypothetical protein